MVSIKISRNPRFPLPLSPPPPVRTDPNLYLLVTFHNLSAPTTVRCSGAYIEVEREGNGFEARWCGNRLTTVN